MASHTYARAERWDSGRDVFELYDAGCGVIVRRVLPLTGLVAVALHGEKGRALVEACRAELAGTLARIKELMIGR